MPGWSSLIVVTCLIGGAILISIGVLGEYIARIFESSKQRPIYLIASQITREQPEETGPVYGEEAVRNHLALLSGVHREE